MIQNVNVLFRPTSLESYVKNLIEFMKKKILKLEKFICAFLNKFFISILFSISWILTWPIETFYWLLKEIIISPVVYKFVYCSAGGGTVAFIVVYQFSPTPQPSPLVTTRWASGLCLSICLQKKKNIFTLILITKLFVLPNRSCIGCGEPESVLTRVLCGTELQTSG